MARRSVLRNKGVRGPSSDPVVVSDPILHDVRCDRRSTVVAEKPKRHVNKKAPEPRDAWPGGKEPSFDDLEDEEFDDDLPEPDM